MTTRLDTRKRSFSYNDLKKKRLQRENKSKTKRKNCPNSNQQQQLASVRNASETISRPTSNIDSENKARPQGRSCYFSKGQLNYDSEQSKQLKEHFTAIKQRTRQSLVSDKKVTLTERRNKEMQQRYPAQSQNLDYLKYIKGRLNYQKSYNESQLPSFRRLRQSEQPNANKEASRNQLVKILMDRSKSKKRLLRLEDIRDKLKSERSKSKSTEKSIEFRQMNSIKLRIKNLKDKQKSTQNTPKKSNISGSHSQDQRILSNSKKTLNRSKSRSRIRKFIPSNQSQENRPAAIAKNPQGEDKQVRKENPFLSPQKQMFKKWEKQQKQILKKYEVDLMPISPQQTKKDEQIQLGNKQQKEQPIETKMEDKQFQNRNPNQQIIDILRLDISQIEPKTTPKTVDKSKPNQSFLGNSVVEMVSCMDKKNRTLPKNDTQNFLDLVGLDTQDLRKVFNNREKKKRHLMDKLERIFPEDFFKK